jgi:UDP-N-acetylmuramoyl-tripeptide--D-alanyl-D-alanine ligase
VAEALGADRAIAATDLASWQPPAGRGTRERVVLDDATETELQLIDDAFNANPASMAAALEVLAAARPKDERRGRRIAILGDMLELGPAEAADHAGLAALPFLEKLSVVHCVGPRMRALHDALHPEQRGEWLESAEEMVSRVRHLVHAGDIVLVKGSKGSKVSLVVDAIRKMGHPARNENEDE